MNRNNLFISKNDKAIRALFQDDEKQYVIKIAIKYYFTNKIVASIALDKMKKYNPLLDYKIVEAIE